MPSVDLNLVEKRQEVVNHKHTFPYVAGDKKLVQIVTAHRISNIIFWQFHAM